MATGKITGQEQRYSRIDLLDFAANVEGAKAAYDALRPAVQRRDAALAEQRLFGFKDGTASLKAEDPALLDRHV